ncbi:MAG: hypothetical protein ACRBFS_07555 [Aureispira sp.]
MTRSTSLAQSVFFFIALFFVSLNANAYITTNVAPPGGPRNVIQERSAIEVIQPTAEHLSITVVDEDGVVVARATTESAVATISTAGWESGEYTVQTIDDDADYQENTITVD